MLKKDALMVSFYGWNRVDRFMAAWKNAGFSVVGHLVFTKNYTSKAAYVGYRHECACILAKGRPRLPQNPLPDVLGWKYSSSAHGGIAVSAASGLNRCWRVMWDVCTAMRRASLQFIGVA